MVDHHPHPWGGGSAHRGSRRQSVSSILAKGSARAAINRAGLGLSAEREGAFGRIVERAGG